MVAQVADAFLRNVNEVPIAGSPETVNRPCPSVFVLRCHNASPRRPSPATTGRMVTPSNVVPWSSRTTPLTV